MSGTTAPKTIVVYDLAGQNTFNIPFEYLARKFITVTLLGVTRKTLTLGTDYRFVSKTVINIFDASPIGFDKVEIRRYTSATERLVDFYDGSILRANDLNLSQIQTLHVAEEARDLAGDSITVDDNGDLDARNRKIVNLGRGVLPTDAVNFAQLSETDQSTLNNANKAAASAAAAKTSETNAKTSETKAKESETNAKTSETNAKNSETNAKSSEDKAKVSETKAQEYMQNAFHAAEPAVELVERVDAGNKQWTAQVKKGVWSRIAFLQGLDESGCTSFTYNSTRSNVVINVTLFINWGHFSEPTISQIGSTRYGSNQSISFRVTKNMRSNDAYLEVFDDLGTTGDFAAKCQTSITTGKVVPYTTYIRGAVLNNTITMQTIPNAMSLRDSPVQTYQDLRDYTLSTLFPVGSVVLRMDAVNPSTLYGGTWSLITGDASLSFGNGQGQSGAVTGNNTPTVPLPAHSHSATSSTAGAHTHTRGTMNITGQHWAPHSKDNRNLNLDGAYYRIGASFIGNANGGGEGHNLGFDASRSWRGETSQHTGHTHSISVSTTGASGATLDVRGARIAINVWRRTA